jgi:hypothetical protein
MAETVLEMVIAYFWALVINGDTTGILEFAVLSSNPLVYRGCLPLLTDG